MASNSWSLLFIAVSVLTTWRITLLILLRSFDCRRICCMTMTLINLLKWHFTGGKHGLHIDKNWRYPAMVFIISFWFARILWIFMASNHINFCNVRLFRCWSFYFSKMRRVKSLFCTDNPITLSLLLREIVLITYYLKQCQNEFSH